MKNFKEYLSESVKRYDFKIKVAGEVTADQEKYMKSLLEKYQVASFSKTTTTPIQELPLDFPKVQNAQVNIYEVAVNYPVTGWELHTYLTDNLKICRDNMVVRNPNEPTETYQQQIPERTGALLNDPDYKEAGNPKFEDYYGDKYNTGFVKELNARLKEMRKERGEEIPNSVSDEVIKNPGQTSNDFPQHNKSPIQQAQDPRK